MAILKKKGAARRKQLSIRISAELSERIESVRNAAKAAGLVFEMAEQVEPQIERIVRQAEKELGITTSDGVSRNE